MIFAVKRTAWRLAVLPAPEFAKGTRPESILPGKAGDLMSGIDSKGIIPTN
jgi:hypothetical protein